jgi:hypothetical protein
MKGREGPEELPRMVVEREELAELDRLEREEMVRLDMEAGAEESPWLPVVAEPRDENRATPLGMLSDRLGLHDPVLECVPIRQTPQRAGPEESSRFPYRTSPPCRMYLCLSSNPPLVRS